MTAEQELLDLINNGNLIEEVQIKYVTNNEKQYLRGVHHLLRSETVESWVAQQPEGTTYSYRIRYVLSGQWKDWSQYETTEDSQASES